MPEIICLWKERIDLRDVSSSKNKKHKGETTVKEELVIEAESVWNKDHDSCSRSLRPHQDVASLSPMIMTILELKPGLGSSQ